jgi:hypothetical protein
MVDPQLDTAPLPAPEPSIFDQVKAMSKPVVVRMDRSRDFATVHGDRVAGDPLVSVFFFQDQLPYSAQGILLWDHPLVQKDQALIKRAAKLLRRAVKLRQQDPEDDEDDDNDDEDEDDEDEEEQDEYGPAPVNFKKWAAGLQEVQWQEVSNAIARKYFKRVKNKHDALELLVAEGEISAGALSKANRKLLELD